MFKTEYHVSKRLTDGKLLSIGKVTGKVFSYIKSVNHIGTLQALIDTFLNDNFSEFEPPPIPHCERLPVFYVPDNDLARARENMQIDQNMHQ